MADVLAEFHVTTPLMTYDVFFGLWLNIGRARYQWSSKFLGGLVAFYGDDDLEPQWFDAIVQLPEQADPLENEVNNARAIAKMRREMARRSYG